jgi:hypothetical protein
MRNGMICLGFPSFLPYGPTLSLICRDRSGTWRFGGCVYGLHAPESRRVMQQRPMDRGGVVEPKKPWASSGCFVLTLCMSGYVGLD